VVRPIRPSPAGKPSEPARWPAAGVVIGAGVVAALLTGCAAHPVQSQEHSTISGQNASVGPVLIRDATIRLTDGGRGVLDVALYNSGQQADSLTGVSSRGAGTITLPMGSSVALPPQAGVFLNQPSEQIMLGRLIGRPMPGQSLPVTLTFSKAGAVNLIIPVLAASTGSQSGSSSSAPAS